MPWAAVGAGVLSAGAGIYGSSQAAGAQKSAADKATAAELQMYNTTRGDLYPYNYHGQTAENELHDRLYTPGPNNLLNPITMDQATLEATPGYKFNLSQGLKSVQNAAAARGLGVSGAALKGASTFATGLADSTYQSQFNNQVINQTNAFNRLMGVAQLGENAAAQTGNYGTQVGGQVGNNLIGAGNAQAAGYLGAGNAIGNGVGQAGGLYLVNELLQKQNGGGGGIFDLAGASSAPGAMTGGVGSGMNPY